MNNTKQLSGYNRLFGNTNCRMVYTSFVLFFICLLSYLIYLELQAGVIGRDARKYISIVEMSRPSWFLTQPKADKLPPPLLLMLMLHSEHYLGVSAEQIGLAISLISGALCSVMVFWGCWILSKQFTLSLLSGFLFFLIPGIRDVSVDVLRDAPSLCFNLFSILTFVLYAKESKTSYLLPCGFLLAISIGFRYENIEFIFLYAIFIVFICICTQKVFWNTTKKIVKDMLVATCGIIFGLSLVYCICQQSDFFSEKNVAYSFTYYFSIF